MHSPDINLRHPARPSFSASPFPCNHSQSPSSSDVREVLSADALFEADPVVVTMPWAAIVAVENRLWSARGGTITGSPRTSDWLILDWLIASFAFRRSLCRVDSIWSITMSIFGRMRPESTVSLIIFDSNTAVSPMSGIMADLPTNGRLFTRFMMMSSSARAYFRIEFSSRRTRCQTKGVNNTPIIEAVDSKDSCTRSIV